MKHRQLDDNSYELDVIGYSCPHPQLYTLKFMEKLKDGMVLNVLTDNPSSVESVSQACDKKGYSILDTSSPSDGVTCIRIQK